MSIFFRGFGITCMVLWVTCTRGEPDVRSLGYFGVTVFRGQKNLTTTAIEGELPKKWRVLVGLGLQMVQSVTRFIYPFPRFNL